MGVRENKVEKYLDDEVKRLGGITRKWVSPGQDGVPDRLVMLDGYLWMVEVKTVDGAYEAGQEREHQRLRDQGMMVRTVWGEQGVNTFIRYTQGQIFSYEEGVYTC